MTPHELIARFDDLAEAPAGVERLRLLVMRVAARGALSTTDARDAAPVVARLTVPEYELPARWGWAPLTSVFSCRLGKMLDKAKNSGVARPYLRNANVRWWSFDLSDVLEMRIEDDELDDVSVSRGDLVICEGGEPGRCAVWEGDAPFVVQKALHRARPGAGIDPHFYAIHLRSDASDGRLERLFTGATIKHLTGQALDKHFVAVPPLAEQKRIVARVDELMTLIDQLDAARTRREQARVAFRDSALSALQTATTTEEVELAWTRVRERFDALLRNASDASAVKKTAIQLALLGRMTSRQSSPSAAELLDRIAAERENLRPAGKPRGPRMSAGAVVAQQEGLPRHWLSVELQALCLTITDGDHLPPPKAASGVPFLTIGNVTTGVIQFDGCRFVPQAYFDAIDSSRRPAPGDILYTVVGATFGRAILVPDGTPPFCVQRHIAILRPSTKVNTEFLAMLLSSNIVYTQAAAGTTGTAQPTVPLGVLRKLRVAVPPREEQDEIVTAATGLSRECDALQVALARTQQASAAFAAAAVHHLDA
ncbi:MAG: restriction endonuclease subunit S [Deltaproteobacteria bacterium]|nr:restriction endonuclease subunit S [Deltaproteobacteria bacterium]